MNEVVTTKICPKCKTEKLLSDFPRSKIRKFGVNSHCLVCSRQSAKNSYHNGSRKEKTKQYYLDNKQENLDYHKRYREIPKNKLRMSFHRFAFKTGIPIDTLIEFYNSRFKKQKGCCAICGRHQTELTRRLVIDHCHKTNKLRGLLCGLCNTGIGNLKDDAELCLKAYNYLRKQ